MDVPLLPALLGYDNPQLIAHGTTALVFRATQTRLNRLVAIKVITADTSVVPVNAAREMATTISLSSQPHIVSIIDTGVTDDDRPYIVMEYCEGGSYAQILRRDGPLPIDDVLEVGTKIGEALHAAHQVGIVHRDVKPSNILRSRFGPALTDFGIARAPDELGGTLTREMMTPHHASPEALLHQAQSAPSDVYSLASTLWTLLVGHPPFVDPTKPPVDMYAFRDRVLNDRLPPMERPEVPNWLVAELARAMAKLPSGRHATAFEFAEALRRGALGLAPAGTPPGPTPPVTPWRGTALTPPGVPATSLPHPLDDVPTNAPIYIPPPRTAVPAEPIADAPAYPATPPGRAPASTAGAGVGPGVGPGFGTDPGTGLGAGQGRGSDLGTGQGAGPGTGGGTGPDAGLGTRAGGGSGPVAGTGAGPRTGRGEGTDLGTDQGPGTGRATGTGVGAGPDTGSRAGTAPRTSASLDASAGPDTGAGSGPSAGTGAAPRTSAGSHAGAGVGGGIAGGAGIGRPPPGLVEPPSGLAEPGPSAGRPPRIEPVYASGWNGPPLTLDASGLDDIDPTTDTAIGSRFFERDLMRPRRRRAGLLVALIAAAVVAVGATAVMTLASTSSPSAGPTATTTPTRTRFITAGTVGAPRDVRLTDRGTSVVLTWTDPTSGTVSFLVNGYVRGTGEILTGKNVDRGTFKYTYAGLDRTKNYCFRVLAVYSVNQIDASPEVCTNRS